jgi:hypothetical protein
MSKAEFKTIMMIGDWRKSVNNLSDLLGEPIKISISPEAKDKLETLEKQYDDFYKLSIPDRLMFSEMGGKK